MSLMSEKQTRKRILNMAFNLGGETARHDTLAIMQKYDRAMVNCTNAKEREMMAKAGVAEIQRYFDFQGGVTVNGEIVVPDVKGFSNKETSKIVKL